MLKNLLICFSNYEKKNNDNEPVEVFVYTSHDYYSLFMHVENNLEYRRIAVIVENEFLLYANEIRVFEIHITKTMCYKIVKIFEVGKIIILKNLFLKNKITKILIDNTIKNKKIKIFNFDLSNIAITIDEVIHHNLRGVYAFSKIKQNLYKL